MAALQMEKMLELKKYYRAIKKQRKLLEKLKNLNPKSHTGYDTIKSPYMYYHLKTSYGGTEAVIDDNCGISKFYHIANALSDQLQVIFLKKIDNAETLDWHFKYKSHLLTLHYNIFNGVSISPQSAKGMERENKAVIEVADFLEKMAY